MSTTWQTVNIDSNVTFRVPIEFEFVKKLGMGGFGTVAAFRDTQKGQKVAVKKITNAFADAIDGKRHLREVRLLRKLKHECIVSIIDMFLPESRDFDDIYVAQDLMDTDLHRVIKSKQRLEEEHHRYFVYQILCAVQYIHSLNLVHRDLKPQNVLVNTSCDIKICDFGLARGDSWDPHLTDYVVTRWWRAPEIVLLPSAYTRAVDIWSIGCILAELLGRKPIFMGSDYIDQIKKIFQVLGTPSECDLAFLPPSPCVARRFVSSLPLWPTRTWFEQYPHASDKCVEVLGHMLCINPSCRIDAKDAMRLPFFADNFAESDLHSGEGSLADFLFDDVRVPTKKWLQNAVYAECSSFHPEQAQACIVELHSSPLAQDGTLAVSCHALSGDVLATIIARPGESIGDLRTKLGSELDEPAELLQLIGVDGQLLLKSDDQILRDTQSVLVGV